MQPEISSRSPNTAPLLARWQAHLSERGAVSPDKGDFLAFGRLSTLERLEKILADDAPLACGPLRAALQELRAEKRARAGSAVKGSSRGPALKASVPVADLPAGWRATLADLVRERERLDAGGIHFDGPKSPAMASIGDMEWILRAIAKSCRDRGWSPVLDRDGIAAWLDDSEGRGCGERGLSLQIGLLRRFLIRHAGKKEKIVKRLAKLRKEYAARGEHAQKRKEKFLLENPTSLGEIWLEAEEILKKSRTKRPASRARQKLVREAAALALTVAVPLRIGDLHRLVIDETITRDALGWSMQIRTSKTRDDYEREDLWPELTPFLDALLEVDAPGGDLWTGYDGRIGTPLFSLDFGRSGLSADWISNVWEEHVGCGAHIVRTLWHQTAWESDRDLTWMALALCGQRAEKTAIPYRIEGARRRAAREGRRIVGAARRRVIP